MERLETMAPEGSCMDSQQNNEAHASRVRRRVTGFVSLALVLALSLGGCSGSGIDEQNGQGIDASQPTSVVADASRSPNDALSIAPDTSESTAPSDTSAAPGDALEPGSVGSPCEENLDCFSGYCIPSSEGYVCAEYCNETCPDGLECRLLTLPGGDPTYICVDPFVHLCQPCEAHSDCQLHSGDTGARCIERGDALGSFCGATCNDESPCPQGFTCEAQEGEDAQCQPEGGTCTCNAWALEIAATTSCSIGSCQGSRTCTADGLSECDAPVAADEACNGDDDDCDGVADESFAVDGLYTHPEHCGACGESCADTIANAQATCGVIDGLPTCVVEACEAGYIQVDATSCVIDSESQCVPCDDTSPCASSALSCEALGGATFCVAACEQDSECAPGFACTTVTKDVAFCLLPTGGCATEGTACVDDAACEDLDPCTDGLCVDGACTFTATTCDDDEPCTEDTCDPILGCTFSPLEDSVSCDDGSPCTEGDLCVGGACISGPAVDCDDGLLCTDDSCEEGIDGAAVCVNSAAAGTCVVDAACVFDGQTNISNPCEVCDALAEPYGWSAQTNGVPCDDGLYCTVSDACQDGLCSAGSERDCSPLDDGACQLGVCDEESETCVPGAAEDGTSCDSDGDGCTAGDACVAGSCEPGEAVVCDDSLSCTDDFCVSAGPDQHTCDYEVIDDACLIGGTCYTALSDHPDDVCLGCFPTASPTSWTAQPEGLVCDDGIACTYGDVCSAGVCTGELSEVCGLGDEDTVACGFCGTQTRSCTEGCQWGEFGVCVGEGVCAAGDSEEETQPCGQCGLSTRVRTCSEGCAWSEWSEWGECVESGTCAPGEVESEAGSCGNCGTQERNRVCGDTCEWGPWGDYGLCNGEGVCAPGEEEEETQSLPCGNCGTQEQRRVRTCSEGCGWGAFGAWEDVGTCTSEGICAQGTEDAQTQVVSCGACGTQTQERTRTCTESCDWGAFGEWLSVSGCSGEGVCTPGDEQEEFQTVSCGNCGTQQQRRTRECTAGCGWGSYGSWQNVGSCSGQGSCSPGQQESQGCGLCGGTQTRSCNASCQWGSFGSCSVTCPSTQLIYRFYTIDGPNSDNHYFSTGANPGGYQNEGPVFHVYTGPAPGLIPLYQLYDAGTNDHLLSTFTAEGAHGLQSQLGYCSQSPSALGSTPLQRLYNPSTGNHFATISSVEVASATANGYVLEGTPCYVP